MHKVSVEYDPSRKWMTASPEKVEKIRQRMVDITTFKWKRDGDDLDLFLSAYEEAETLRMEIALLQRRLDNKNHGISPPNEDGSRTICLGYDKERDIWHWEDMYPNAFVIQLMTKIEALLALCNDMVKTVYEAEDQLHLRSIKGPIKSLFQEFEIFGAKLEELKKEK